ncbi:hypothetical protein [Streptomyces sp. VNUA74]|uniref:hypothetical protein n=1 Tax=Streptomyces sp. VNUA74 TaxID=3062685 RepID=UPI00280AA2D7|nr:hypothetical protein [Streptomyces sp. VNUA74]WML79198.1 hypothetical protein Q3101_04795 [Streptomyces sp. VNUA74]
MSEPKLTVWEKARIAKLEFDGIRNAAAGVTSQPHIDREINRIKEKARKRAERQ